MRSLGAAQLTSYSPTPQHFGETPHGSDL